MSSSNDPNVTVIETPVAQGPRGLTGPQGPRGPSGDEPDISPDEGNRIEQRANGIYSPPVEMPEQPQSSLEDIDDAVSKKHEHTNKKVLDGFSYEGGQLKHAGIFLNDTTQIEEAVNQLSNDLSQLATRTSEAEQSLSSLENGLSSLELITGETEQALNDLELSVQGLQDSIAQINSRIDDLEDGLVTGGSTPDGALTASDGKALIDQNSNYLTIGT